jgi:hypothetical protein
MARYGYMIANLRLRAHAGTLMPGDVRDLGTYFR